jgi:hypothetical protein
VRIKTTLHSLLPFMFQTLDPLLRLLHHLHSRIQAMLRSMQLAVSSMQQSISTMQQGVHSVNLRVEQSQLDIQECLKHHHPSSSDDEDDAPVGEAA